MHSWLGPSFWSKWKAITFAFSCDIILLLCHTAAVPPIPNLKLHKSYVFHAAKSPIPRADMAPDTPSNWHSMSLIVGFPFNDHQSDCKLTCGFLIAHISLSYIVHFLHLEATTTSVGLLPQVDDLVTIQRPSLASFTRHCLRPRVPRLHVVVDDKVDGINDHGTSRILITIDIIWAIFLLIRRWWRHIHVESPRRHIYVAQYFWGIIHCRIEEKTSNGWVNQLIHTIPVFTDFPGWKPEKLWWVQWTWCLDKLRCPHPLLLTMKPRSWPSLSIACGPGRCQRKFKPLKFSSVGNKSCCGTWGPTSSPLFPFYSCMCLYGCPFVSRLQILGQHISQRPWHRLPCLIHQLRVNILDQNGDFSQWQLVAILLLEG